MIEFAALGCGFLIFAAFFILPIVLAAIAMSRSRKTDERLERAEERMVKLTRMIAEIRGPALPTQPSAGVPVKPPEQPAMPAPPPAIAPAPAPALARLSEWQREDPPAASPVESKQEAVVARPGEKESLEAYVGQKILPWLGVTVFVLGIAFFLWYAYSEMGPKGRVALAGATGTVMVAAGVVFGRRERYALLGGSLMAGGWAVLYGTAYAVHYIDASRIVTSPLLGFFLLFAVGAAAVIHALLHDREWIVAMAYGLVFISLFHVPDPGPSAWLAMGISAAGLVLLAWRRRWIKVCTIGALVLYAAEVAWLKESTPGNVLPMSALLVGLWMVFLLPNFFHRPKDRVEEAFHAALVFTNFVGVLILGYLIHEWLHTPRTGTMRLLLGCIYAVKAVIGRRHEWRPAWMADMTFALILLGAGSHEWLDGIWPSMAWLGLSTLLFVYGVAVRESYPRLLAAAGLLVAEIRIWTFDRPVKETIAIGTRTVEKILLPVLAGSGLFYAFAGILARIARDPERKNRAEQGALLPMLHAGAVFLGLAIWYFPPELYVALLFAAAGLGLAELGGRLYIPALTRQGLLFAVTSVFFVASVNLTADGAVMGISKRLAATVPVLAAWLYLRETVELGKDQTRKIRAFLAMMVFGGLLSLLRFELGASGTPLAWTVAAVAWLAWGLLARRPVEFFLGAVGAACAILMFAATRNPIIPLTGIDGSTATGVTMVVMLAALHAVSRLKASLDPERPFNVARGLLAVSMAGAGFVMLEQSCSGTWLTGSWAVLGLALGGYGFVLRDRVCRWTSLVILGICMGKVGIFDLANFAMPVRIATLMVLGGVMIALSFVYVRFNRHVVDFLKAR